MNNEYRTALTVNELLSDEAIFEVARVIALTDSIGEGYGYCDKFTEEELVKFPHLEEYRQVALEAIGRVIEKFTGIQYVESSNTRELINYKIQKYEV